MSWIEWNYPLNAEQINTLKTNNCWPFEVNRGIPYLEQSNIRVKPKYLKTRKKYIADNLIVYRNGDVFINKRKLKVDSVLIYNTYLGTFVEPLEHYHYFWDNPSFRNWGNVFGSFVENFVTGGQLVAALAKKNKTEEEIFKKLSELGFNGIVKRSVEDNIPGPVYDVITF